MNEIKNAVKSTDRRMDQAEGRVYGLEDRNFEITQSEENKGKRVKKSEENLHDIWHTFTRNNLTITGQDSLLNQIMADNFPNLRKDLDIQVHELKSY